MRIIQKSARISTIILLPLLLSLASCSSAPFGRKLAEAPADPISWVELGPNGLITARVITGEAECPKIKLEIDGVQSDLQMELRSPPSESFAVRVCEGEIPRRTKSATLGDVSLPLPIENPRKILVIGDTGCRIVTYNGKTNTQNCNDPHAWPFPTLAKNEANSNPDLIIHLGDYLYREAPCPADKPGCSGSPFGYNWESWNADFFEAARPLLKKAPWIFLRGNHELCKRAGEGWFRFFDPNRMHACTDGTEPYFIKQGENEFVVLDSALATDFKPEQAQIDLYQEQFKAISEMPLHHAWLLSHRPMWAPALADHADITKPLDSFNQTLQAASQNKLPAGIQAVLAGHLHIFQEFHFTDQRPPQYIVGNGGTALTPANFSDPRGLRFSHTMVRSGNMWDQFGYLTLENKDGSNWTGTLHDVDGEPRLFCKHFAGMSPCVEVKAKP